MCKHQAISSTTIWSCRDKDSVRCPHCGDTVIVGEEIVRLLFHEPGEHYIFAKKIHKLMENQKFEIW